MWILNDSAVIFAQFLHEKKILCNLQQFIPLAFETKAAFEVRFCWSRIIGAFSIRNAQIYNHILMHHFLARKQIVCFNHPFFTPNLQKDYFLYPKLNLKMKFQWYEPTDGTEESVQERNIAGDEAFQEALTDMYTRFKYYIELKGDYLKI